MLKKLASPRKRTQPPSFDSPDAGGVSAAKSPEKKKDPKPKPKVREKPKEKEKPKPKEKSKKAKPTGKTEPDAFGFGETATEALIDETKDVGNTGVVDTEATTPSPRKSIARAFRRKTLLESGNASEDKSPTKKPLASPKKSTLQIDEVTKAREKPKLVDKKREAKSKDQEIDPNAESAATTEKDPLTPRKSDTAAESPKRKTRWKIPDIKHHNSSKTSNNQKDPNHKEEKDSEPNKAPLSPANDNNGSRETSPSRVREKRGKPDKRGKSGKRQLSAPESLSDESEQENQTNVLSPIRRHKADPDDTLPIPESPYNPYRVQKCLTQLDVPPAYQPEVHLMGEIVSGHGFGTAGGLTCKWRVEYGSRWSHIAGDQFGQTQVDYPSIAPWTSDPDVAIWAHPIDLHFATSAFQGWPKLLFQVWRADSSMKLHIAGYGFVPVPFAAGQHQLWVSLWRPLGTTKEELDVQLLGRTPELKNDDVLFNAAWSERCRLRTVSTGKVLVHIGVLLRHFQAGVIEA